MLNGDYSSFIHTYSTTFFYLLKNIMSCINMNQPARIMWELTYIKLNFVSHNSCYQLGAGGGRFCSQGTSGIDYHSCVWRCQWHLLSRDWDAGHQAAMHWTVPCKKNYLPPQMWVLWKLRISVVYLCLYLSWNMWTAALR